MSDDIVQRYAALRGDLPLFASSCLTVRTKAGTFVPMVLNEAQRFVHNALEAQREEKGWVRALLLKGRQQGASTYVAARFYHRAAMRRGVNTFILTHEQSASDTLFGIVDRFQRGNPFAPHVGTSNSKELEFDKLDSSYVVATAGGKPTGRSKSITLYHGSECAFWPNASDHFAASVQAVPLSEGTEIVLESTSAGAGGEFYERCVAAEAGLSDYQLIFLPWWLTDEYQREPEAGFLLSSEQSEGDISEQEYADIFKLPLRRMAWRRAKIIELRDPLLFRREYPATVGEAWTAPPGHEPYIDSLLVLRARKRSVEGNGPLIVGVDPASGGGDRFAMAGRRGLRVEWVRARNKLNHEEAVVWVRDMIDTDKPSRVNIDAGNIGANIVTSLKNLGQRYAQVVRGVNFGGTSEWRNARPKVPGPYNRRAEMYQRLKEWLELPEGVALPDEGALQSDICAPKQKPRLDNFFMLESKEEMKARGIRSPDLSDATALTFAFREYFSSWHEPARPQTYGDVDSRTAALEADILANDYADSGSGDHGWMG